MVDDFVSRSLPFRSPRRDNKPRRKLLSTLMRRMKTEKGDVHLLGNLRVKKLEEGTIIGNLCQEIRSSRSDTGDWE